MRQGVNVKHFSPCIDKPLIFIQEQTLGCSTYVLVPALSSAVVLWLAENNT